jgi:hypothetical protein
MKGFLFVVGVACLATVTALAADGDKKGGKKVEMKGTLHTGVVATGGETTGIVIDTKDGKYELELGKGKKLRQKAKELNGKSVVVAGTLVVRKGVEVRERKIITVTSLKASDEK